MRTFIARRHLRSSCRSRIRRCCIARARRALRVWWVDLGLRLRTGGTGVDAGGGAARVVGGRGERKCGRGVGGGVGYGVMGTEGPSLLSSPRALAGGVKWPDTLRSPRMKAGAEGVAKAWNRFRWARGVSFQPSCRPIPPLNQIGTQ